LQGGQGYATLVARRTRQYPLDFGNASSFVETIDQPVVEADGRKWLENVGFDGMAEVEFKFDPRDGKYKILDVNMRAWDGIPWGKRLELIFHTCSGSKSSVCRSLPFRARVEPHTVVNSTISWPLPIAAASPRN